QKLFGTGVARGKEMRDSMNNDARLAGTGAGKNQQRTIDVLRSLSLFRIELSEKIHPQVPTPGEP
ncbi:MAG TPA: hypothetical protein VH701_02895, partial [Vicinamibacterales bacterium]